jgi:hypothetical protein
MKKYVLLLAICSSISIYSQSSTKAEKTKGRLFGGLESNSQWYLNDVEREINHPDQPIRSNNYLLINYNYGKWTAGIQGESYAPKSLLNFNPKYEKTNLSTYYLNYKSDKIDVTAGYFYEQFGSGLLLRSWEDRSLGINNSIRGGKIVLRPTENLSLTGLYGNQRTGFDVGKGIIYGFNSDINLSRIFEMEKSDISVGFSYVGREEKTTMENPNFKELTNSFSGRFNFSHQAFYFNSEYNYKSEDAILYPITISNTFVKPGSALLTNFGYTKKGVGLDVTLRRIENMNFLSERNPEVFSPEQTSLAFNDRMMNFVPSLTKQHHSNLANIYVFQAQKSVSIVSDNGIAKAGEIGGQIDFFYEFKKGSSLGGKYGTKIAVNASNWFNLKGDYTLFPPDYNTDFFASGKKYFSDYNLEITKKFNPDLQGSVVIINQYYDHQLIAASLNIQVNSFIIAPEISYKITPTKSIKIAVEHMWANSDRKNWAALMVEYTNNINWSFYVSDMYNYGFDKNSNLIDDVSDHFKIHFYNLGTAYTKGSTRIALSYGRQRGGLVCAGGICRFVPPSSGIGLSLTKSF